MKSLKLISSFLIVVGVACNNQNHAEVHLIQEHYEGWVAIMYNVQGGADTVLEDTAIIYRIPPDGIIKLREPLKEGIRNVDYYYVNETGDKRRLYTALASESRNIAPAGVPAVYYKTVVGIDTSADMSTGGTVVYGTATEESKDSLLANREAFLERVDSIRSSSSSVK